MTKKQENREDDTVGPPMTADEMKSAVTQWMEGEGYPAEYQASSILKNAGFDVRRGLHVHDPDANCPLEIDVQAACNLKTTAVHLIAESKVIPQHRSWVFFSGDRPTLRPTEALRSLPMSPLASAARWLSIVEEGKEAASSLDALLCSTAPLAYGAKSVSFKKKNDGYTQDKANGDQLYHQISATVRRARLFAVAEDISSAKNNSSELRVLVSVPIVIAGGDNMFLVEPAQLPALSISPQQHIRLMWMSDGEMTVLNVATHAGLRAGLAKQLFLDSKTLAGRLKPYAERIVAGFTKRADRNLKKALELDVEHPHMIKQLRLRVLGGTL